MTCRKRNGMSIAINQREGSNIMIKLNRPSASRFLPGKSGNVLAACFICLSLIATPNRLSAGERLSLDADWRFTKDDPADAAHQLDYAKIKDWIEVTGNEFTKNPSAAKTRPAGNPAEVAYAQSAFDDSQWRWLNLPHDWGIEG